MEESVTCISVPSVCATTKEMNDKRIVLLVNTNFQKDVIEKKYLQLIKNTYRFYFSDKYFYFIHLLLLFYETTF